ncbi:MAG: hypothetical protein ACHQII_03680 [Bacteroidia bacterium]
MKNDTSLIMIASDYDKNGKIIAKKTQLSVYLKNHKDLEGMGFHGSYQEFHPNGQLKLNAQYLLNRRVGCRTWYNVDGSFWAEWDYQNGKAPQ